MHLLRASSAQTLEEGVHLLQDARGSQELLRCAADWLRLLVRVGSTGCGWMLASAACLPRRPPIPHPPTHGPINSHELQVILLRERSVWHPTYSPLQLRRAVVHILAAGGLLGERILKHR